jgi:SEC-C motif-containing protein
MTSPTPKPTFSVVAPCPCGSGQRDAHCCLPILRGEPAPTAEALMRSRYTAYVRHDERHLLASWHPSTRPQSVELGAERWHGLDVVDVVAGGPDDDSGIVEFEAKVEDLGRLAGIRERSRFVRHRGRWVYVDAEPDSPPGRHQAS